MHGTERAGAGQDGHYYSLVVVGLRPLGLLLGRRDCAASAGPACRGPIECLVVPAPVPWQNQRDSHDGD